MQTWREGTHDMEDVARALTEFVRDHQAWAAPVVFAAGLRRVAGLHLAAGSGLGRAGGDRRADRRSGISFWPIWIAGGARRGARRLAVLLDRLPLQGTRRADVAAVAISGHAAARRSLREEMGRAGIFIGAVFGPLRATVPLVAGIFEMPYWPFQIANFVSALVWSAALLLFGDVMRGRRMAVAGVERGGISRGRGLAADVAASSPSYTLRVIADMVIRRR